METTNLQDVKCTNNLYLQVKEKHCLHKKRLNYIRAHVASILNMSKHQHNFLSADHTASEIKTWWVIALCSASMILEIGCGIRFGSLALIADGIHMSTHAFAFLITARAASLDCMVKYSGSKSRTTLSQLSPNLVFVCGVGGGDYRVAAGAG